MQITQAHIQNFRSLRDLHLELDETTVLIGANNAGKTAILEALRIALSRRWGHERDRKLARSHGFFGFS